MVPPQMFRLDAPKPPILKDGEVHIWRADLKQDRSTTETLTSLLSADERRRASKYYFQRDRDRFVIARGVLRTILGRYLNLSPVEIGFSFNQYGKPALCKRLEGSFLKFNLAHSQTVALYALTHGREIGIDIEYVDEDCSSLDLAERFFSPTEASILRGLAPHLRTSAFFDCWTRKEAYIKARGQGLSFPLNCFTVSLTPGQPPLLTIDDDPLEASRWMLIDLFAGLEFRSALAIEGDLQVLHSWQWLSSDLSETA